MIYYCTEVQHNHKLARKSTTPKETEMNKISQFAKYLLRTTSGLDCLECENQVHSHDTAKSVLVFARLRKLGLPVDKMRYCAKISKEGEKDVMHFNNCCSAERFLAELQLVSGQKIIGLNKQTLLNIHCLIADTAVKRVQLSSGVPDEGWRQ